MHARPHHHIRQIPMIEQSFHAARGHSSNNPQSRSANFCWIPTSIPPVLREALGIAALNGIRIGSKMSIIADRCTGLKKIYIYIYAASHEMSIAHKNMHLDWRSTFSYGKEPTNVSPCRMFIEARPVLPTLPARITPKPLSSHCVTLKTSPHRVSCLHHFLRHHCCLRSMC